MFYKYNCGKEIITVWVWNDNYHNDVIVTDNITRKSYNRTIRENTNGKFFTWNKNKIYIDNWIKISMRELKEKIKKKEWCTSDELCRAILTEGIENVRLNVPMNIISMKIFDIPLADGNQFKKTLCKIEERYNYEVKNNYKLTVTPVNSDESVSKYSDFYTTDMLSLIQDGIIEIVI